MALSDNAGIDFKKTFGSAPDKASGAALPKAEFWLNVGYYVKHETPEGVEDRFVSLPTGIPLDTQEALKTNSRSADYNNFNAARNDLHDQIMQVAGELEAGEERVLNLSIQLRRVSAEVAPAAGAANPFLVKVAL